MYSFAALSALLDPDFRGFFEQLPNIHKHDPAPVRCRVAMAVAADFFAQFPRCFCVVLAKSARAAADTFERFSELGTAIWYADC
jgi:hypothetical protein